MNGYSKDLAAMIESEMVAENERKMQELLTIIAVVKKYI